MSCCRRPFDDAWRPHRGGDLGRRSVRSLTVTPTRSCLPRWRTTGSPPPTHLAPAPASPRLLREKTRKERRTRPAPRPFLPRFPRRRCHGCLVPARAPGRGRRLVRLREGETGSVVVPRGNAQHRYAVHLSPALPREFWVVSMTALRVADATARAWRARPSMAGWAPPERRPSASSRSRATSASTCAMLDGIGVARDRRTPAGGAGRLRRPGHSRRRVDDDGQARADLRPLRADPRSGSRRACRSFGTCAGHDHARRPRARTAPPTRRPSAASTSPCGATRSAARSTPSRASSTSPGSTSPCTRLHPGALGRGGRPGGRGCSHR